MNRAKAMFVVVGVAVLLTSSAGVYADYYDDFSDGNYSESTWQIDNPRWWFYPLFGAGQSADASYQAVRLVADANPYFPVYAMAALAADDLIYDANTSATWWDDTTSHYILCKVYYPGYFAAPNDPNFDRGDATIVMHGDPDTWTSLMVAMPFHNCAYRKANESYHFELENFWNQHINLQVSQVPPPGSTDLVLNIQRLWCDPMGRRPDGDLDPNHSDPNDTTKLTPPEDRFGNGYRIRSLDNPKYLNWDFYGMERDGFWLILQFEIDANYPPGNPHGKWLRSAFWTGDKYDWDGTWCLSYQLSDPYWSGGDPNTLYAPCTSGRSAVMTSTSSFDAWGAGFPSDVVYDDFEARVAVWNGIPRSLNLYIVKPQYGSVAVHPRVLDPNDPNTADERLYRFTDGTPIVIQATPISGKAFDAWTIWEDASKYPDANFAVTDSNTTIYLTMNSSYVVESRFKCGSGLPPFVAAVLLVLGAGITLRRLW